MLLRFFSVILSVILLLSAPLSATADSAGLVRYSKNFYDAFDTVITLIGYAENEAAFDSVFGGFMEMFIRHHQVYDGYTAYEGVNNLYALNHAPAGEPVPVEQELMDLLVWAEENQPRFSGRVNIAMGSVLEIWHDHRAEGLTVPAMEDLLKADEHIDLSALILDRDGLTVTKTDGNVRIDLGAVAKGYTVEKAAQWLLDGPMPSFLINAGGNVRCGKQPYNGKKAWSVGVEDPDNIGQWLDLIYANDLSIVTSGDYQRYYIVDGIRYHHIIDPDTLMPAAFVRSVTIVTEDSGLADMMSTALFNMDVETGRAFVDAFDGAEAYWIGLDGSISFTDGLIPMLYSQGAVNQ